MDNEWEQKFRAGKNEILLRGNSYVFKPSSITKILTRTISRLDRESMIELNEAIDMGTGSGVIAIYLAKKGAKKVYGIDLSEKSCEYAKKNTEINGVSGIVNIYQGDLFEPLKGKKVNLIVDEVSGLVQAACGPWYGENPEDGSFKIPTASEDGSEPNATFIKNVNNYLKKGGHVIFPFPSLINIKKINNSIDKYIGRDNLKILISREIPFHDELKKPKTLEKLIELKKNNIIDFFEIGEGKYSNEYSWKLDICYSTKN